MSRLAKKPIMIPAGVSVEERGGVFYVKGPKGEERVAILPFVSVAVTPDGVVVTGSANHKQARANLGTTASLIAGAIAGATTGFVKKLEIEGVGYKAALEGKTLVLSLGYVNPVRVPVPEGIEIAVEKNTMTIAGTNKDLVGRTAAGIRALKKPEPYKGRGIRYQGEVIVRKVGKKAATAGAA